MNNKNIIGNGSKATLPDGQKLSDKIQENKIKQGLNNNVNNNNSNSSVSSLDQKDNNNENDKGKSKVDNSIQNVGSEALKKSLKAAFPYVPQFLINKLVDSNLGQAVIEKTLNKTKQKIIFGVLGICLTLLMQILLICTIVAAILSPVSGIKDALGAVGDFFTSVWNIFKYGEFCESDSACQEKLGNKYYDKLDSLVNDAFGDCEQIDTGQVKDLITATIFYDQMMYDNDYALNESTEDEDDIDDETLIENNSSGYFDYRGKRKKIKGLVDKLKDNNSCVLNSYTYRNHLTNNYVKNNYAYVLIGNYKDGIEGKLTLQEVVNEIMMIGGFENKGSNGTCSDSCVYKVNGEELSDIKVRLIYGKFTDKPGEPIENEELVPFEKYVLGVVYAEIGSEAPDEALKTQAIAARSYALLRGKRMGGALGRGLHNEDGEWILTIVNSTEDQVYCDPDKGCSKIGDANSTTFSDPDKYKKYKGPLAEDARIRSVVAEVAGVVAIDSEGNIINTPYVNSTQNSWTAAAKEGKDYTMILGETYLEMSNVSNENCSELCSAAKGQFTEWKQYNWPDIYMNKLTLKQAGCLTVSVCMQLARSGVETPLGTAFNPGTFVDEYRDYLYNGDDNWTWVGITNVVPQFYYDSRYKLTGLQYLSYDEQIDKLLNGINNGCYYVVEVKQYQQGQHWVAIDTIKDGEIYIMDPSSNCTVLSECKASQGFPYKISIAQCYRVID